MVSESGYWKQMIESQKEKVKFGQKLKAVSKLGSVGISFFITYHPKLTNIVQIMKKLEHLLYQDESVKRVVTPPPMVFYRSTKLYPLERKIGSYKCSKSRYQVCNNIEEIDILTNTVTDELFQINHHLCCKNKCLIHLLTCNVCKKQHTGKIVVRFKSQWNNYKETDKKFLRGEQIKQKSSHEHFLRDGPQIFEKDVSTCLTDKTDHSDQYKKDYR